MSRLGRLTKLVTSFSGNYINIMVLVDDILKYRIQSNYHTYPYKRTVKQFRSRQITASVLFVYFFIKAYVVGYSFELHRLVDAIQMSNHNICLCKENQKKSHNHHQISLFLIFFIVFP